MNYKTTNKQALGFLKTLREQTKDNKLEYLRSEKFNLKEKLSLFGTLDSLAGNKHVTKLVKKEHPTDKGYFKEVYVLTFIGKVRLKRKKSRKIRKTINEVKKCVQILQ